MLKLSMFFYTSGYEIAFPFTPTLTLLPYGSAVFLINSIWSLQNSADKLGHVITSVNEVSLLSCWGSGNKLILNKWQQTLDAFNEPSVDLFLGFNWEKNTLP